MRAVRDWWAQLWENADHPTQQDLDPFLGVLADFTAFPALERWTAAKVQRLIKQLKPKAPRK